jgi:ATP-binding cassette subfamily B multidrug efflux pump
VNRAKAGKSGGSTGSGARSAEAADKPPAPPAKKPRGKKRVALFFMLSHVKRHAPSVAFGVVLLMVVDYIQIRIPRIIQETIDFLSEASFSQARIDRDMLTIMLLAVAMVVLRFFWRILIIGSSRRIEREVRVDMFSHLQGLGFSFFNRTHTGDLMALMINDVSAIRMATGLAFIALTDAVFMGTLSLLFMFKINTGLALYAILPLPVILLMMVKFGPSIHARFTAVQESFASLSTHAQESFSGIRVVKGFARNRGESVSFEEKCDDYVDKNIKLIMIWGFFFPTITLLANLSLAILFLVGGRSIILNTVTFGQFISFTIYINLFVWPVVAIGWVFNLLQRGIASSGRVLELLNEQPDVFEDPKALPALTAIEGRIETKNLSFRYAEGEREVLKDVTLEITPGSALGIMGKPGSGKSTLISLFFRLFPVENGRISVDGMDIHRVPIRLLRSSIGFVPQDPFLFSDTIRNNIAFGLDERQFGAGEVERAARLAAIHDEIVGFRDGFETVVGERGVTLSGGQKQRLSIARALLIRPKVLILDDAFSSVDTATESEVLSNVRAEMKGRTMIIISHRVSTVKDCDAIVVLEEGRVAERGSHEELLALGRYYSTLYELQKLEERVVR